MGAPETMLDGNTAALKIKMAKDDRDDDLMRIAEARRPELVAEFITDPESRNQHALMNHLADLTAGDATFLHWLQRIHVFASRPITPESEKRIASTALSMVKLFQNHIDIYEGDDLVQEEADRMDHE